MNLIGKRLREERKRLGFNQADFGAVGGVQKLAQLNYEKGERSPDAGYLAAVARIGADVLYILTERRNRYSLSDDENELLMKYRAAPGAVKAAVLAALTAGSAPQAGPSPQVKKSGGVSC